MPVPPAVLVRRAGLPNHDAPAKADQRRAGHRVPALRALPGGAGHAGSRPMSTQPAVAAGLEPQGDGTPLLEATGLSVSFSVGSALAARLRHEPHTLHALDGVDLRIQRGAAGALVGESGSGKATLARGLTRRVRPSHRDAHPPRKGLPV